MVGDTALADERWGFSVGDNGASMVGDLMWFGPLKRFQKLFFHTPLVNVFVAGSEAYHDYYRWPLRDKRVYEQWRAETSWGRLFEKYQRQGTLAACRASRSRPGARRVALIIPGHRDPDGRRRLFAAAICGCEGRSMETLYSSSYQPDPRSAL